MTFANFLHMAVKIWSASSINICLFTAWHLNIYLIVYTFFWIYSQPAGTISNLHYRAMNATRGNEFEAMDTSATWAEPMHAWAWASADLVNKFQCNQNTMQFQWGNTSAAKQHWATSVGRASKTQCSHPEHTHLLTVGPGQPAHAQTLGGWADAQPVFWFYDWEYMFTDPGWCMFFFPLLLFGFAHDATCYASVWLLLGSL